MFAFTPRVSAVAVVVTFRTRQLEKCYLDVAAGDRTFGKVLADRYVERINILRNATSFQHVRKISRLRCHQLKGERLGEWAINLDRFHRLIFTYTGGLMEVVCIEEVSKHYGD